MNSEVTTELILNPDNPKEREIMIHEREFGFSQRQAQALCKSTIVPPQYQGNIANCVVAMEMARRLNVGHLEVMQNLYIINKNPSFSSKYLIARINTSGILKGRLRFEFEDCGEKDVTYEYTEWSNNNKNRCEATEHIIDKRCRAIGTEKETGIELMGTWISIEIAVKEGWYSKTGSKWKTIPDLMLQYRAASFWANINAPEATMGMTTVEEQVDISEKDITPEPGGSEPTKKSAVQQMVEDAKQKEKDSEGETVIEASDIEAVEEQPVTEDDKQPEQTLEPGETSSAFKGLQALLDMVNTEDDINAVVNNEAWPKLQGDEKYNLNEQINAIRLDIRAATQTAE